MLTVPLLSFSPAVGWRGVLGPRWLRQPPGSDLQRPASQGAMHFAPSLRFGIRRDPFGKFSDPFGMLSDPYGMLCESAVHLKTQPAATYAAGPFCIFGSPRTWMCTALCPLPGDLSHHYPVGVASGVTVGGTTRKSSRPFSTKSLTVNSLTRTW